MTDDLISIGTIGLIKGIDTYKNNKKLKLLHMLQGVSKMKY